MATDAAINYEFHSHLSSVCSSWRVMTTTLTRDESKVFCDNIHIGSNIIHVGLALLSPMQGCPRVSFVITWSSNGSLLKFKPHNNNIARYFIAWKILNTGSKQLNYFSRYRVFLDLLKSLGETSHAIQPKPL